MALLVRTRLVALTAAAATLLAFVGISLVRADPSPSLPAVAPDRLLASTLEALREPVTVSGDVVTELDLGLPELPSSLAGEGGAAAMVSGTQRFKVWHAPAGLRVAHILEFSEQDLVVNRDEAWWWDAGEMTATRLDLADLPAGPMFGPDHAMWNDGPAAARAADPLTAARAALDALAPFAEITVDGTARVAGRPVYALALTPRSELTLIARIVVAIDERTRLPLRVQVFPRGSDDAAVEAGFTSVSFGPIDPAMFTFAPPPGADVEDAAAGAPAAASGAETTRPDLPSVTGTRVFGESFDTRVAWRVDGRLPPEIAALLPYGGPLASAIVVERGNATWVLFGFVGLEALQRDANRLT